jgi:hypothetical protein
MARRTDSCDAAFSSLNTFDGQAQTFVPSKMGVVEAASKLGSEHNGLEPRLPGQPFERGLGTVPRRVKVAAIKRDQRARRFEDRIRLIRERLTAGVRKSRCKPANRFELADQNRRRRRRSLTDLIERELGEAL